jgi:peptidoglycan hydrolase-like protein with peptidoglycan-binding domain
VKKLPALLVLFAMLALPVSALAQTQAVTLSASSSKIVIGHDVTLSGTISPAAGGETVEIQDANGTSVATATTDASGAFSASVAPPGTTTYHAVWGSMVSPDVTVRVRATISASMSPVRLFDDVTVRGVVRPARPGDRVEVDLLVGGKQVASRHVAMNGTGHYVATFSVDRVGTYRARASFVADDLLVAKDTTGAASTPLPSLSTGSRGTYVKLLEQRLVDLHYRLVGTNDGRYDARTADAVIAFHKVQRMPRTGTVNAATWRALADPIVPKPRYTWRGLHFEVNQTLQVAMVVVDGDITDIFHVSTGKPSTPTHDGLFRVYRKLAGYSPNHLYYPSYFDGNRALHGWTDVPTYAASHGCVRIPYWNALWVYGLADIGTRVAVYH